MKENSFINDDDFKSVWKKPLLFVFWHLMLPLILFLFYMVIPDVIIIIVHGWIILSGGMLFFFLIRPDHLLLKDPLGLIYGVYLVTSALFFIYIIGVSLGGAVGVRYFRIAGNITLFGGLAVGIRFWRNLKPLSGIRILLLSMLPLCLLILLVVVYPFHSPGDSLSHRIVNISSYISALGLFVMMIPFMRVRAFKNQSSPFLIVVAFLFSALDCLIFTINTDQGSTVLFAADLMRGVAYFCLMESVYREAILRPLSSLRSKELELRREKLFYDQTLAAVKDTIFRYYPERSHMEISKVWEDMTGHPVEEMEGEDYYNSVLYSDSRERLSKAIFLSGAEGKAVSEEVQVRHKNGSSIWVLVRGRMEKDLKGEPCFVGLVTDISWRKKIEKELIVAKEKAEESNRLKTGFLANISHEIRTPLNVLIGFTGLLVKDIPPDHLTGERLRYLELIRESSNQLISIISNIIDISRIQNERIELHLQKVELEVFFKKIHTVYRKLMDDRAKREIRLVWRIPPDLPGEIILNTEIERFHQIWQNLLNNAMKFIEYGQICYGVDRYDPLEKKIVFFVEDTGPGVAADKDKIIFERFRQAEEGLARRYGGSGLGLTICRELLQIMKGEIHLDKTYTKGARFLFTLPEYTDGTP